MILELFDVFDFLEVLAVLLIQSLTRVLHAGFGNLAYFHSVFERGPGSLLVALPRRNSGPLRRLERIPRGLDRRSARRGIGQSPCGMQSRLAGRVGVQDARIEGADRGQEGRLARGGSRPG